MRIRIAAAVLLILVGVGAVAFTLFPPGSGSTSSTKYITAAATREDVVKSVVATGTVGPVATYSLAFGSLPAVSSSGSSSSSSGLGVEHGHLERPHRQRHDRPGRQEGRRARHRRSGRRDVALTITKATLASAEAKLTSDQAGLNATDKAVAQLSVTQAQASLSQAQTAQSQRPRRTTSSSRSSRRPSPPPRRSSHRTRRRGGPGRARFRPGSDRERPEHARVPPAADHPVQHAGGELGPLRAAPGPVAQLGYTTKTAPATTTQIASDQRPLPRPSRTSTPRRRRSTTHAHQPRRRRDPGVNITPGVDAPSGAAITIQSASFQVAASVTESDLPSLKVGQAVDVTITATKQTATGKLVSISPRAPGVPAAGGVVPDRRLAVDAAGRDRVPA